MLRTLDVGYASGTRGTRPLAENGAAAPAGEERWIFKTPVEREDVLAAAGGGSGGGGGGSGGGGGGGGGSGGRMQLVEVAAGGGGAEAAPAVPRGAASAALAAPERIPPASRIFLWWCGLRGGVAFALALHARQLLGGEAGEAMVAATLCVVALSLLAIPPAIRPLARALGLEEAEAGAAAEAAAEAGVGARAGAESAVLAGERGAELGAEVSARAALADSNGTVGTPAAGEQEEKADKVTLVPDASAATVVVAAPAPTPAPVPASVPAPAAAALFDAEAWLRAAVTFLRVSREAEIAGAEGR